MRRIVYLMQILILLFSIINLNGCTLSPPSVSANPQTTNTSVPTQTQNSISVPTTSPTTSPTIPTTTQAPTTQAPATEPSVPDLIGNLYTRSYLESLDNTLHAYGCGRNYNNIRPHIPIDCQAQWGDLNATFLEADTPTVYLTFDCGYEFENLTASILDTLQKKNIKAVFFVTMHYCKSQPQLVKRMINEGHIVGNHSGDHHSMPALSLDEMVAEIMNLHEYVKANFGYTMTLFRPPKGEYSTRSLAVAQSLGYQSVFWSFAYQDWNTGAQPSKDEAFRTVSSCAHNGCIYLLHSVSATNAEILGDIIDDLQNRGYTLELYQKTIY